MIYTFILYNLILFVIKFNTSWIYYYVVPLCAVIVNLASAWPLSPLCGAVLWCAADACAKCQQFSAQLCPTELILGIWICGSLDLWICANYADNAAAKSAENTRPTTIRTATTIVAHLPSCSVGFWFLCVSLSLFISLSLCV